MKSINISCNNGLGCPAKSGGVLVKPLSRYEPGFESRWGRHKNQHVTSRILRRGVVVSRLCLDCVANFLFDGPVTGAVGALL